MIQRMRRGSITRLAGPLYQSVVCPDRGFGSPAAIGGAGCAGTGEGGQNPALRVGPACSKKGPRGRF